MPPPHAALIPRVCINICVVRRVEWVCATRLAHAAFPLCKQKMKWIFAVVEFQFCSFWCGLASPSLPSSPLSLSLPLSRNRSRFFSFLHLLRGFSPLLFRNAFDMYVLSVHFFFRRLLLRQKMERRNRFECSGYTTGTNAQNAQSARKLRMPFESVRIMVPHAYFSSKPKIFHV